MTARRKNNTKKCVECECPIPRKVLRCPPCAKAALKQRPIYTRTHEHRKLMSAQLRGKPKNYPTGGSIPGVTEKIRQSWTPEKREAARQRGIVMTADPKDRLRFGRPGMLNANFQGGQRMISYAPGWTKKRKLEILERDKHRCQNCGTSESLHVHHIDLRKIDHSSSNLVTLCHPCHFIQHRHKNPPSQDDTFPLNPTTASAPPMA